MQIIIEAFLLGLVGGVVPGSVLTILLVSVMQGGFKAGMRAFSWCMAAEVSVVFILLILLLSLPITPDIFLYLALIGGLVLFYFALQILKLSKIDRPYNTDTVFSAEKIYLLSATNAPLYIFWVTVCAPLIWQLAEQFELYTSAFYFMVAFELGWGLSTFGIMLLFLKSRNLLTNPKVMTKVYLGIALFMTLLGVRMWYTSLQSLNIL